MSGHRAAVSALLLGALALGAPRLVHADAPAPSPGPRSGDSYFDPGWSHSNAWDYSFAGASTAALIVDLVALQPHRPPLRWDSPILFDSQVRSVLRSPVESTRNSLSSASWGLWGLQVAYPVLVDVPFAWVHYRPDVARDLFWQDAATLTFAGAVDAAMRDLFGRARPAAYDCLRRGGKDCLDDVDSTRSFPGGHFVNSTAASVLTCTQHLHAQLYGGPWDALTCAMTLASDLALGVMRIVSDDHWASDQLAGAAIGAFIGWAVPYAIHIRGYVRNAEDGARERASRDTLLIPVPMVTSRSGALTLIGIF